MKLIFILIITQLQQGFSAESNSLCCRDGFLIRHLSEGNYRCVSPIEKSNDETDDELVLPCRNFIIRDNTQDIWFKSDENGSAEIGLPYMYHEYPIWLVPAGNYCVGKLESTRLKNSDFDFIILCELEFFDTYKCLRIFQIGLDSLSLLSIVVLSTIYLIVSKSHNTDGWIQFVTILTLLCHLVSLHIPTLYQINGLHIVPSRLCFYLAILHSYFLMAFQSSFLMMNSNLFWILFISKHSSVQHNPTVSKTRLFLHIVVSWVFPLIAIICICTWHHFTSDFVDRNEQGMFKYAHDRCMFPGQSLIKIWNYIWLALLTALFTVMGFLLCRNSQGRRNSIGNTKYYSETLKMFIKLGVSTGFMLSLMFTIVFIIGTYPSLVWYGVPVLILNRLGNTVFLTIMLGFNSKLEQLVKSVKNWRRGFL